MQESNEPSGGQSSQDSGDALPIIGMVGAVGAAPAVPVVTAKGILAAVWSAAVAAAPVVIPAVAIVVVLWLADSQSVTGTTVSRYEGTGCHESLTVFSNRSGDMPARGDPDSTQVVDRGHGEGTIRDYGPDGKAAKDFDFGHNHGAGDPHVHDWDWSKAVPRQPGRPLMPGE